MRFPKPKRKKVVPDTPPVADENFIVVDKEWHLVSRDMLIEMLKENVRTPLKYYPKLHKGHFPVGWVQGVTDVPRMFPPDAKEGGDKQVEEQSDGDGQVENKTGCSSDDEMTDSSSDSD